MKAAKSECRLCRERMRNSDSGHKCWIQTLTTFPISMTAWKRVSRKMVHSTKTLWMKQETEAIGLILKWLEKSNPFNLDCPCILLNRIHKHYRLSERAAEAGREMQINLKGKSVTSMYHAGKV